MQNALPDWGIALIVIGGVLLICVIVAIVFKVSRRDKTVEEEVYSIAPVAQAAPERPSMTVIEEEYEEDLE